MRFKILSILAISTLLTGFFGCTRDNSIVDPNNSLSRVPLAKFGGQCTSSLQSPVGEDPLQIMNKSKYAKLGLFWGLWNEGKGYKNAIIETQEIAMEWPFSFKAQMFNLPPQDVLFTTEYMNGGRFGLALIALFDDVNNNNSIEGIIDYRKRFTYPDMDTSLFYCLPDSIPDNDTASYLMKEYPFFRIPNKDVLIGLSKSHSILFIPDSFSLVEFKKMAVLPDSLILDNQGRILGSISRGLPGFNVDGLQTGYNLIKYAHITQYTGSDGIIRKRNDSWVVVDWSEIVEMGIFNSFTDYRSNCPEFGEIWY